MTFLDFRVQKRAMDIVVSLCVMAVTAPLAAVAVVLVKATSPGPVLYRAARAGRHGQQFDMFKFRTMSVGVDHPNHRVTGVNDSRITPVGRWLRKTKIDEIPQLVNVLRGEMSIVGPRPEDIGIVQDHYGEVGHRTLTVRPGIASYPELRWYPDLLYHDPPPNQADTQQWYLDRHLPAELAESDRYVREQSLKVDLAIVAGLAWKTIRYALSSPPIVPFTPTSPSSTDGASI